MTHSVEAPAEHVQRVELKTIAPGDVVRITTGLGNLAFRYTFVAEEAGMWPKGHLEATRPDGTTVGPLPIYIHGSGKWTTRRQNPVQTQERAFTSYFDSINQGDFLVAAVPNAPIGERIIFDKPGQEITAINIEKQHP